MGILVINERKQDLTNELFWEINERTDERVFKYMFFSKQPYQPPLCYDISQPQTGGMPWEVTS